MDNVFNLIKELFWNHDSLITHSRYEMDQNTYKIIKQHSIIALFTPAFSHVEASDEIRAEWKKAIFQHTIYNTRYQHVQSHLPISVPYVVLKGTTAAQYYPHPEYRTMGDIDIITKRDDYEQAFHDLLNNGYKIVKELDREVSFVMNGVTIELHRYFSSLNDPEQANYLDHLIIDHINPSHILPDDINGLVILEHINQHMEKGLGLRQIIDWMMFVDKCLPDEKWPEFKILAESIGLETLAEIATKMCSIYLGLPQRKWYDNADERISKQLMEYIMMCGNFGNTKVQNISTGENVFYYSSNIKSLISLLQERGLVNWKAAQKHKYLKPFAWVYQGIRYIIKGFGRDDSNRELISEYRKAKERDRMFKILGVKQDSKGTLVFRNGEFAKK